MEPAEKVLRDTDAFLVRRIATLLSEEIDIRGRGYRRNFLFQWCLYAYAMARDIARIPLHDPRGIGQARFRARVLYIQDDVLPTLEFLHARHPLAPAELDLLDRAMGHLRQGAALVSDGPVPVLDEWYASMGEFHDLQRECGDAVAALTELLKSLET